MQKVIPIAVAVLLVVCMCVPFASAATAPYWDYRMSGLPSGLHENPESTAETGLGVLGGIVWLNSNAECANVTINCVYRNGVYIVTYNVFWAPISSFDSSIPLFAVCADYPVDYDVTVNGNKFYNPSDYHQSHVSGLGCRIFCNGYTNSVPEDLNYVCHSGVTAMYGYCYYASDSASHMVNVQFRITEHDFGTPISIDPLYDVTDVVGYPWTLPVNDVFPFLSEMSTWRIVAPIVFGSVFVMIAGMVLKMMM